MRSISGVLNRTALAGCGLLIVAMASWLLASGLGAGRSWPEVTPFLASAQERVDTTIAPHGHWLLPAAALVSVLAVVAGLVLLGMQVPRKAAASPLRLTASEGTLLATISPDVLSQALSERGQDTPGVQQCTVWVTGSPSSLWVQATATVSQGGEVEWAVAGLRHRLEEDVTTSLGAPPRQVDVLVRLESSSSSRSHSRAVMGQHAPESTGNGDET
ncbi:hypothetical protein [Actinomyces sp. ZJ308]|uniref:hypothetical protein n=1 Tax=Actinomyces sp. ZJ308 TaxID=2708342 RepID=UPI0014226574|nr:hypothetical protein [Actinomyces sp. ZJ308]